MKFSSHATIEGKPTFDVKVRAEPIGFKCGATGSLRAQVGPVRARVRRVPIALAVPFLGGLQQVGAVGPFDLRLDPLDVAIESFELQCDGVLGPEGLTAGLEGGIGCRMEVDVHGKLPGRIAKVGFELDGERQEQEE